MVAWLVSGLVGHLVDGMIHFYVASAASYRTRGGHVQSHRKIRGRWRESSHQQCVQQATAHISGQYSTESLLISCQAIYIYIYIAISYVT